MQKVVKTLEKDYLPRQEKYEQQERKPQGRNSYSKTDVDATCMRMKEDRAAEKPLPRPAYNVQMGTENQFIVGFSIHQQAGDTTCLIPHLEKQKLPAEKQFENMVADAGYGSEDNYAYLEEHRQGNYPGSRDYVKYNTFHQEQHPPRNQNW